MEMELGGGDVPPLPDACAPVDARFKGSTEGEHGPKLGLKSKGKKRQKPIAMMVRIPSTLSDQRHEGWK